MNKQVTINPIELSNLDQSTVYSRGGGRFRPVPISQTDFVKNLDVGVYTVNEDLMGLFFQHATDFGDPGRVYGNANARATRILNTFQEREGGLGVLCVGEKGSGKTMLSKIIAHRAGTELGIPTIIVNQPLAGDAFCKIIRDLPSAVILFDEFEKVYPEREQQGQILTLLEGVYSSNKLFLFTANNQYALNQYMINRPGRIFYYFQYDSLEREFIIEYCEENLKDKDQISSVLTASMIIGKFNFDMLKSMVEEMNRYNESAKEVMGVLNIRPMESGVEYDELLILNGVEIDNDDYSILLDGEYDNHNPTLSESIGIALKTWTEHTSKRIRESTDNRKEEIFESMRKGVDYTVKHSFRFSKMTSKSTLNQIVSLSGEELPEDKIGNAYLEFTREDLKRMDQASGELEYATQDGMVKLVFKPKAKQHAAYYAYM